MIKEEIIQTLYDKDDKLAYNKLLELENMASKSNETYMFFDEFVKMLKNEKSFIRVRGFRIIAKNAKWDTESKINDNIYEILQELEDEKPTAVRQCLAATKDIIINKTELNSIIKEKLLSINYLNYKESMQGLIFKDVETLLKLINIE